MIDAELLDELLVASVNLPPQGLVFAAVSLFNYLGLLGCHIVSNHVDTDSLIKL
jgi:hypothetical protein